MYRVLCKYWVIVIIIGISSNKLKSQSLEWGWSMETDEVTKIITDAQENIYMIGSFFDTVNINPLGNSHHLYSSSSNYGEFLAKYDYTGNLLWGVSFGNYPNGMAYINDAETDSIGNIIITGSYWGTIDFNPSPNIITNLNSVSSSSLGHSIFIAKYDVNGNLLWAKNISTYGNEIPEAITTDKIGNIIITGRFGGTVDFDPDTSSIYNITNTIGYYNNIFILKLDYNGNFIWVKQVGGGQVNDEQVTAITHDDKNNLYLTGYFYGHANFETDTNSTFFLIANSQKDAFLLKLSPLGDMVWAKAISSPGNFMSHELGIDLKINSKEEIYITGLYNSVVDIDPSSNVQNILSNGGRDIFLCKYDKAGNLIWGTTIGGVQDDYVSSLVLDSEEKIYIYGTFSGSNDFDYSSGVDSFSSNGDTDFFVTKLDSNGTYINTFTLGSNALDNSGNLVITSDNDLLLTGSVSGSIDLDISANIYNTIHYDYLDVYLARYTQELNNLSCRTSDSLTLVDFHTSTNGVGNAAWQLNNPINTFYGITLNANDCVENIHILNRNVTGELPTSIGDLSELEELYLKNNELVGSIPKEIGLLNQLNILSLAENNIGGELPDELCNLSNLGLLELSSNDTLHGEIPSCIGAMTALYDIYMEACDLDGSLPEGFGNLKNVGDLFLRYNDLSGVIPDTIGTMTSLQELLLDGNDLEGAIPISFTNLLNLSDLWITSNNIDSIPDLSSLPLLTKFYIQNNKVTFDDILPNMSINDFTYAPQDTAGIAQTVTESAGATATLQLNFDYSVITSTYTWYKDGNLISTTSTNFLTINNVQTTDAGVYTVEVTNSIATDLTLNTHPITLVVQPSTGCLGSIESDSIDISCNGLNDGEITITPSNGTAPYTYQWFPNASETDSIATNLLAGQYMVTVTDANNCIYLDTIIINEPTLIIPNLSNTQATCGNSDGTALATPTGGTGNYSYAWNTNPSQSNNPIINLSTGTYTVTVTDANNCIAIDSIIVSDDCSNNPCNSSNISTQLDTTICINTSIVINGNTYDQNTTTGIETFNSYQGCDSLVHVNVQIDSFIGLGVSQNNITCHNNSDGSIFITPNGGEQPYNYNWSHNATLNDSIANNLTAGNYSVTVTDSLGCSNTETIQITEPNAITIALNSLSDVSCFGGNDGSLSISASGGTGNFSYNWNNSTSTSNNLNGLTAGNYTVTATDANNCSATFSKNINEPNAINISLNSTDISCQGDNDGSISATVNGGNAPYQYLWNTNDTLSTISNLNIGNYTLTITDSDGCTSNSSTIISQPNLLQITNIIGDSVLCFGTNTGAAQVNATGGTTPYSYLWTNNQTTSQPSNLSKGWHSVTLTDANNCLTNDSIFINEPPALTLIATALSPTCNGTNNGSATVSASGGVAPYAFQWDNGETNSIAAALATGIHQVTVTDFKGCTFSDTTFIDTVGFYHAYTTNVTDVICFGESNGTATINTTGGISPFTYLWSNGETNVQATQLSAGTHYMTVTDVNGCISQGSTNIFSPNQLGIHVDSSQNIACFGDSSGMISLSNTGGVSPVQYQWADNSFSFLKNNLTAGNHSITITDANGCNTSASIVLTQPNPLFAVTSTTVDSCQQGVGSILIDTVYGGVFPYQFSWSDQMPHGSEAYNLSIGAYEITVTDANNCNLILTKNVITACDSCQLYAPITFVSTPSNTDFEYLCIGDGTAFISLTIDGGQPNFDGFGNYKLLLNGSSEFSDSTYTSDGNTFTFEVRNGDNWSITVSDELNCSYSIVSDEFLETPDDCVDFCDFNPVNIDIHGDTTILAGDAVALWATGGNTIDWTPSNTLSCYDCYQPIATPSETTTYTATVSDAFQCTANDTVQVKVYQSLFSEIIIIPNLLTMNNDGISDVFHLDNLELFENTQIEIFNRWGQRVYLDRHYDLSNNWGANGDVPAGTYFFILTLQTPLEVITGYFTVITN